ncbi:porin [Pelomonas sp. KK5]|uniref:porin n=1 Tax=Pelomonas sp. KK5 TaxID=1855730 RepID=UPI00097C247B|nr:porin [Pelomonas sp. KK5]
MNKKTLIALAALAVTAAHAQSSVTLFGVVDLAVRAVKNGDGGTTKAVFDGGANASRLGFRGEEDLGDGLKAGFWLEMPVFADTGGGGTPAGIVAQGGAQIGAKLFQRRATVSLSSRTLGEIRLGRDFDPSFLNLGTFDVYQCTGFAGDANIVGGGSLSAPGILGSGVGTIARVDNSVAYYTPNTLGGFYASAMVAAGEGSNTSNGNNAYRGARLGWYNAQWNIAAAAGRTKVPGSSDFKVWNAGASYDAKVVYVTGFVHQATFTPAGLAERKNQLWGIGARVPVGLGDVHATLQHSNMSGGNVNGLRDADDVTQIAVGYTYNLSIRTALHADVGRLQNKGLSALAYPGGTAAGSGFGTLADRRSTAVEFGIRHSF